MFQTGWPSLGQPAFALKPLGLFPLNHQVTAKFFRFEPSSQHKLANPRLRNTEHPRDLCCGQRIDGSILHEAAIFVEQNPNGINYNAIVIVICKKSLRFQKIMLKKQSEGIISMIDYSEGGLQIPASKGAGCISPASMRAGRSSRTRRRHILWNTAANPLIL